MDHDTSSGLPEDSHSSAGEVPDNTSLNGPTRLGLGLAAFSLFFSFYGLVPIAALIISFYGLHKTGDVEKRGQRVALCALALALASFLYSFAVLLLNLRTG